MTPQSRRHPRDAHHIDGPISFLNPTKAYVDAGRIGAHHQQQPRQQDGSSSSSSAAAAKEKSADATPEKDNEARRDGHPAAADASGGVYHLWRSRDNRKGRHAVVVSSEHHDAGALSHPGATASLKGVLRGLKKMLVRYPVWDVSYDVATIFTLGSVVWVFNGFFVWLPVQDPWTEFPNEVESGGGITAFIGATIFEIGSVLLMFEAVNENRTQCFGWALEEAVLEREKSHTPLQLRPDPDGCSHHHTERRSLLSAARPRRSRDGDKDKDKDTTTQRSWQWWPTWQELRTHYLREIGFLACLSQFIGASIFWIAGLTGLPPIYDALSGPVADGVYWLPQVVGGAGFIVSGWLFMLETQPNWYTPALGTLGWHIGFWNLIGAFGFTLCGALGFASEESDAAAYASALTTFIGSWAFLIGSVVQWYESLDKYPITVGDKIPGKSAASDEEV